MSRRRRVSRVTAAASQAKRVRQQEARSRAGAWAVELFADEVIARDTTHYMREAGMTVHQDSVGNIRGRYEGAAPDAPALDDEAAPAPSPGGGTRGSPVPNGRCFGQ